MKKNYSFQGESVPGEEIEFEVERENFNSYFLADGTKMKFKTIVMSVVRLDRYALDGAPVYIVNSSNVVSTDCPPGLMKKQDQ